jgi:hypothetical protein
MKTFLWGLLACVLAGNAIAADVPMDSLILIPKGSPPGSPANGQMWSTSAGFFGKSSSGGVVGPFGTGAGSGTVTSVGGTSTGSTLTPTGGPVTTSGSLNFELNLSHANTWTGLQSMVGTNFTGIPLAAHVAQAANTVVANVTGGSAAPTAVSVPGCVDTGGNHLNYTGGTGFSCGTTSSGGAWTITDGTHSVANVTTLTVPIGAMLVGGSGGAATLTPVVTLSNHAGSFSSWNLGGEDDMTSSGTATEPTYAAGQTTLITAQAGVTATIGLNGQTNPGLALPTTLHQYGFYACGYQASTVANCFGFPGFGTITSGALMKFTDASGAATAGVVPGTGVETAIAANLSAAGGLSTTIGSGTATLGTGAISSAACATAVVVSIPNTATTDVISWGFNGDPTAVTGYVPLAAGMLTIIAYPTSGNANFKVCNNTSSSITPGAITLNVRVIR